MALREVNEKGETYDVPALSHQREFNLVWLSMSLAQIAAIEEEINRRLDQLLSSPDPNWGSITNTSIEGGRTNPKTGIRGDWSDGPFQAIFEACGLDEDRAGMFYGNVWKKIIIERPERWIGIRSDPTFPNRGITLQGKTYFLDKT
jgi:hypothetical protein